MSLSLLSRRELLRLALAAPVVGQLVGRGFSPGMSQLPTSAADDPWLEAARILARIAAPVFPNRDVDMTRYKTINEAVDACSAAGGGRVVVPAGSFTTGPIRLKSRVNLHLADGAVLKFSTDPKDYLPLVHTRYEGVELMNYSPLIYAYDAQDVAITGRGTLDGQAGTGRWWDWKGQSGGRRRLMEVRSQ
jgi:hypothetical protein